MLNLYLIYTLIDPRDIVMRYVGITSAPIQYRLSQHMTGYTGVNSANEYLV
jgi:hypothetical protein